MQYLTTSRVAHELVLSEAAVRKLANNGVLPVVARLSDGTRLFDPSVVEAYAKRRRDRKCERHAAEHVLPAKLFRGRAAPISAPDDAIDDGSTEREK